MVEAADAAVERVEQFKRAAAAIQGAVDSGTGQLVAQLQQIAAQQEVRAVRVQRRGYFPSPWRLCRR